MSHSRKGAKGIGYEYWSKRPMSKNSGCTPDKFNKTLTHHLERKEGQSEIDQQIVDEVIVQNDILTNPLADEVYAWVSETTPFTEDADGNLLMDSDGEVMRPYYE